MQMGSNQDSSPQMRAGDENSSADSLTDHLLRAEQVVEQFEHVEPAVAAVAKIFVPGAAPLLNSVQPWLPAVLKFVEHSLIALAHKNGGDVAAAVIELMQHMTPGQPNSSVLTDPPDIASGR